MHLRNIICRALFVALLIPQYILFSQTIGDIFINTYEDSIAQLDLQEYIVGILDDDNRPVEYIMVVVAPTNGTITLDGNAVTLGQNYPAGVLTYRPNVDYFGRDTLNWLATNGELFFTSPSQVELNIQAVADVPSVPDTEIQEDAETPPLVITRNAVDSTEVTHFRVTGYSQYGTLRIAGGQSITEGTYITDTNASIGVVFTPSTNFFGEAGFIVHASLDGQSVSPLTIPDSANITVLPVGDTPRVTSLIMFEDDTSGAITILPHIDDGPEVTDYNISGIVFGALYLVSNDQRVFNNDFINLSDGGTGVYFVPDANSDVDGGFDVEASENGLTVAAQSGKAHSTIVVTAVADPPNLAQNATFNIFEDSLTVWGLSVPSPSDVDGSEYLSPLRIAGMPSGTRLSAGTPYTLDSTSWDVPINQVTGLSIELPLNHDQDFDTYFSVTTTESSNGDTETSRDTMAMVVTPLNDAPQISVTSPILATEDISFGLSPILLADVDAGSDTLGLSFRVIHGTVKFSDLFEVNSNGSPLTGDSIFTLTGPLTALQNAINAGIEFKPLPEHYHGDAEIQLQMQDNGATGLGGTKFDLDTIRVQIAAVNDDPIAGILDTIWAIEDDPDTLILLSSIFSDPDSFTDGDSLSYTITIINPTLIDTSLRGDSLWIIYRNFENGTATLNITAWDEQHASVTRPQLIVVAAVNNPVTIINTIPDSTFGEDFGQRTLMPSLDSIFYDPDVYYGAPVNRQTLVYTVVVEDPSLITPIIIVDSLQLIDSLNQHGNTRVTLRAADSFGSIDSITFLITVTRVNDTPTAPNPIGPISPKEDDTRDTLSITGVFYDPDIVTNNDSLILTLGPVIPPGIVVPTLQGTSLYLDYVPDSNGYVRIPIIATDTAGAFVTYIQEVYVGAVNDTVRITTLDYPTDTLLIANYLGEKTVQFDVDFSDKDSDSLYLRVTRVTLGQTTDLFSKDFNNLPGSLTDSVGFLLPAGRHTIYVRITDSGESDNGGGADTNLYSDTDTLTIAVGQPLVSSTSRMVFVVGDTTRGIDTIRVSNGPIPGTISVTDSVRLLLPPNGPLEWALSGQLNYLDTLIDTLVINALNPWQIDVLLLRDLDSLESFTVTGLQVTGLSDTMSAQKLRIVVDRGQSYSEANGQAAHDFLIGDPSLTFASEVLPVNLVGAGGIWKIPTITLANGPIASTLSIGDTVRIRIPDTLACIWIDTLSFSNDMLSIIGTDPGGKILLVRIDSNFAANQTTQLTQLLVEPLSPSSTSPLQFDTRGTDPLGFGPTYPTNSSGNLAVTRATIRSERLQTLVVSDRIDSLATLSYWESGSESLLLRADSLRLKIPTPSPLKWVANHVELSTNYQSPTTVYGDLQADSTVLVMPILTAISSQWTTNDTLYISNAQVKASEASTDSLFLLVATAVGDSFHSEDLAPIVVGWPKLVLSSDRIFYLNAPSSSIGPLVLYEDANFTTIDSAWGFELVIPDGFPANWSTSNSAQSVRTSGSYSGTLDSLYLVNPKTLHFNIDSSFVGGDTLVLDSLLLENLSATSYNDTHSISLRVPSGRNSFPLVQSDWAATGNLAIGQPVVSMNSSMVLLLNNINNNALPRITITEDPRMQVISANTDTISLILTGDLGLRWLKSVPIVIVTSSTGENLLHPQPYYSVDATIVHFELPSPESLNSGDEIYIQGLFMSSPTSAGVGRLGLSLDGGLTLVDTALQNIRVSTVTLSSRTNQLLFRTSAKDFRRLEPKYIRQSGFDVLEDEFGFRIPKGLLAYWDEASIKDSLRVEVNKEIQNKDSLMIDFSENKRDIYIGGLNLIGSSRQIQVDGLYLSGGLDSSTHFEESSADTLQLIIDRRINSVVQDSFRITIGGASVQSLNHHRLLVGDSSLFNTLGTIELKEDSALLSLKSFNSLSIFLPSPLSWDIANDSITTISGGGPIKIISVTYPDTNEVSIPISSFRLGMGVKIQFQDLRIKSATETLEPAFLQFQFRDAYAPILEDSKTIGVGRPQIRMTREVQTLLNRNTRVDLPEIVIQETGASVFGTGRKARIKIANTGSGLSWIRPNISLPQSVLSIDTISNSTIEITFSENLGQNRKVILAGLALSALPILSGGSSSVNAGSIPLDGLPVSTNLTLLQYDVYLDSASTASQVSTAESIKIVPDIIFDEPVIYAVGDSSILSFALFPGQIPDTTILRPEYFQITRSDREESLFEPGDQSYSNLVYGPYDIETPYGDTLSITNMPFLRTVFSNASIWKLNQWFDDIYSSNKRFDLYLQVDQEHIRTQFVDADIQIRDSLRIRFQGYNPERVKLIGEAQVARVINRTNYPSLGINLGGLVSTPVQLRLAGKQSEWNFPIPDSLVHLASLLDTVVLDEGFYTMTFTSADEDSGIFPIIRSFVLDYSPPELLSVPLSNGIGRGQLLNLSAPQDSLLIELIDNFLIRDFGDTLQVVMRTDDGRDSITTPFFFTDILLGTMILDFDWNGASPETVVTYLDNGMEDIYNWRTTIYDLIMNSIDTTGDDDGWLDGVDNLPLRIYMTFEDQAGNYVKDTLAYRIFWGGKSNISSEIFNYPNPFSVREGNGTQIRYVIRKNIQGSGTFVIFNAGGSMVFYQPDLSLQAGVHNELVWDGRNLEGFPLATGVYFGFLQVGDKPIKRIKIAIINR